ncbi:MAG TPA: hexosyltransferase [Planctomycetaceae bacterium]|nr:hexosyltransferase [Planctomycetaceae bacterium]
MYCGSCLHDNAIARALMRLGHDALLVPTYTPILTDEHSAAADKLFFGGLNVYLQQLSPVFRWLPKWADGFLSQPKLVQWIASRSMGTTADKLGALTVSMLRGRDGNQRKEVDRLCDWLKDENPDAIVFSNLLIAGCAPTIKDQLGCPIVVILQGDDIFYSALTQPHKDQAATELRRLAQLVDRFVVHSSDYAQRMASMLDVPMEKMHVTPLSIDTADFANMPDSQPRQSLTIGYLARLAPEKGLHLLVDAFIDLAHRDSRQDVRLDIAGWLGPQHEAYWQEQKRKISAAGLDDRVHYHGSVDRVGKLEFLSKIELLCVPTTYREPKGLFVLEALAAGVPYVLPDHGAFPELHARHDSGHLVKPEDQTALADKLSEALDDLAEITSRARLAREQMLSGNMIEAEAKYWLALLEELIDDTQNNGQEIVLANR